MKPILKTQLSLYKNILQPKSTTKLAKAIQKIETAEVADENITEVLVNNVTKSSKGINYKKLEDFNGLAHLVNQDETLTQLLWKKHEDSKVNFESVADLARNFDTQKLIKLFQKDKDDDIDLIESIPDHYGKNTDEKLTNFTRDLETKLFTEVPIAGLQRVLDAKTLKISNTNAVTGVTNFLAANPNFDIRKQQLREVLAEDTIVNALESDTQIEVLGTLKNLQRLATISNRPEEVAVLYNKKFYSSQQISKMDGDRFVATFGKELGEEAARAIHNNATANVINNTYKLMQLKEHAQGTQVAMIDNAIGINKEQEEGTPISYEALFGNTDFCECGHCNSVYSPSAYFVELLEYIRSNNLDITVDGYKGTPLEKLFWRRPDLKCLQLTCTNAFIVLPYIDLVNEVMESFIVHNDHMAANGKDLKIQLDVYNTSEDDDSSTLLAQPQHMHQQAYDILDKAVYPFSLPYNQPMDATRQYLEHLKTSRYELMTTFQAAVDGQAMIGEDAVQSPSARAKTMQQEEEKRIHSALCAEYLGLSESQFIIIAQEGFATKQYYETLDNTDYTDVEYQDRVGIKQVQQYYFAKDDTDTTSLQELSKVKDEFLPRTGLTYVELVDLLKTNYINPYQPYGTAKAVLEDLQLSYAFLQSLVDTSQRDLIKKYKPVVDFIFSWNRYLQNVKNHRNDPCEKERLNDCLNVKDILNWVFYHFENIGKMIVLESNDTVFLYPGYLTFGEQFQVQLQVNTKGEIIYEAEVIGKINNNSIVEWEMDIPNDYRFYLYDLNNKKIGQIRPITINDSPSWLFTLIVQETNVVPVFTNVDTCDISKVRLQHLDGTALTKEEYNRFHRFIRLWRKTEWNMYELDSAILGLNSVEETTQPIPSVEDYMQQETANIDDCNCKKLGRPTYRFGQVNVELICELASVKQLVEETNLSLEKLVSFWSPIATKGNRSLYAKLFLRKNLIAKNPVFTADTNGGFLEKTNLKISDHLPGLMAALSIKGEDIELLDKELILEDQLTLQSASQLYRHQLLARHLKCTIEELLKAKALFGDPFDSIDQTKSFIDHWQAMEKANLSIYDLQLLFTGNEDAEKLVLPSLKEQLQLAKTIWESIQEIEETHQPVEKDSFTKEVLESKLGLFYEPETLIEVISFIEHIKIWETNAPSGLVIDKSTFPFINYVDDVENSKIIIQGILNDEDRERLETTISDHDLTDALERVQNQQQYFFHTYFSEVLTYLETLGEREAFKANLFESPLVTSVEEKGFAFLKIFIPFLKDYLKNQLLLTKLSGATGLTVDVCEYLTRHVLKDPLGTNFLLPAFRSIGGKTDPDVSRFTGFLLPKKSGTYIFEVTSKTKTEVDSNGVPTRIESKGTILINGTEFETKPIDNPDGLYPSNIYQSRPFVIKLGEIYEVSFIDFDENLSQLRWKIGDQTAISIPKNALFEQHIVDGFHPLFKIIYKAALFTNAYDLSVKELQHLQTYKSSFNGFEINGLTLSTWKRLHAYAALRDQLPNETENDLIDLFAWAENADPDPSIAATLISEKISNVIGKKAEQIKAFINHNHFNIKIAGLKNEIKLLQLIDAIQLQEKINAPITTLFDWAKASHTFNDTWDIATNIQQVVQARYDLDDWEEIVKPINDKLRTNQRNALIAYLLNQKALQDWGVTDADALFEFFLIDVQMESCMETSRIKQAISTTQLFIQRVLLNLEDMSDINESIDWTEGEDHIFDKRRERWEWMSRYRVWEANRKVFLYPENWIRPELRDTKSELYQALESELLQKDINTDMVKDVLKNYLYGLDEIADMKVVGMYAVKDDGNPSIPKRLHVISRTRTAPYFFYYRKYESGYWYPWEKMQIDIPSYDYEKDGQIESNGAYVIPVEWNNRLFVFFPQFLKKTKPKKEQESKKFSEIAEEPISNNKHDEFWEIKMAFSEFKNGVWSQKKISEKPVFDKIGNYLKPINDFNFDCEFTDEGIKINFGYFIDPENLNREDTEQYFLFGGNSIQSFNPNGIIQDAVTEDFGYKYYRKDKELQLFSYPEPNPKTNNIFYIDNEKKINFKPNDERIWFTHSFSKNLLESISISELNIFFDYLNEKRSINNEIDTYFGGDTNQTDQKIFHELKQAYSLYNWELFFHLPITVAQTLSKNQQFGEAMKWYHFVFNPYENGTESDRFWKFLPFKETDAQNYLETFFKGLAPGQQIDDISQWRDDPFNPHGIARSRTVAYMKWVVMEYLDNLLDWGDNLFRQDTIESVNYATQLYILAGHILGKRPQQIPKRGKLKPQSYAQLLPKLDAFSNAGVELELLLPFSNQITPSINELVKQVPTMNIFGMASTQYFCTPNNPKLMGYWDTVADRLFKIRHCQNIEGIFRKLSLFEPPIDPALLVNARANSLSISSVLNDLYAPIPNYRFNYLLQKAFELCNEVKSLGNQFLSIKEKKDGERMQLLRSKHEIALNDLLLETRKLQLEEAQKSLSGLYENRKSPEYRMKYYLQLIGEDLAKIPDEEMEFMELADKLEPILNESGLKLIPFEKEEMERAQDAANDQEVSGILEAVAAGASAIPNFTINTQPMGGGTSFSLGGAQASAIISAFARGYQTSSNKKSFHSSNASRKTSFTRQLQERIQQCNLAGRECKQIDKQITAQRIRIDLANQEITNHQQQIENSKEVEEFLKNKYTNEQLYQYMEGHVKTLFYQAYTMAYDLAKKAEGLFRFERGLTTSNYIKYGYWNSAYDGLLAGEQLYNGLKQLEIAYQDKRGHDYEVVNKQISLRKLNPMQLLQLRETGSCEFEVSEWLFDMDFAGHYMRRIKTVSFSIPCISGPYINISATARLLEHSFRVKPMANGNYNRNLDEDDERFMTSNVPIQSVALSSGQNDGGLFELNFRDERYMPFEGAGCISKWRIEFPKDFRQFDYDTISDVILHMSYTSKEGGGKLKKEASDNLRELLNKTTDLSKEEGLFAFFDLKHDFSQEWYKAMQDLDPDDQSKHKLELSNLLDRLPYFADKKAKISSIYLYHKIESLVIFHDENTLELQKWNDIEQVANTLTLGFNNKIEKETVYIVLRYSIEHT